MASCTGQVEFVAYHPIKQQPIRFDVRITVVLPVPPQGVILLGRRQRRSLDQQSEQVSQLGHVLAALLNALQVSFE
jgi:hypothetical protein